ncbi:unnamed protein product [Lymnaea stagnalis]|uniref:Pseudouridine synthase RsuA/RluA-like domain-containing protein n=1 Tax=Lymnaea stagnalis TaxID=6523 RepID=A0AAV2IJ59_LYMST
MSLLSSHWKSIQKISTIFGIKIYTQQIFISGFMNISLKSDNNYTINIRSVAPTRCENCTSATHIRNMTDTVAKPLYEDLNTDETGNVIQDEDPSNNYQPFSKEETVKPLSKKALKRIARAQKHKELKRKRREDLRLNQKDDPGYSPEDLLQSSYYFENGLRKVYPYTYIFATHAKGRWVGRTIHNVLASEFGFDQPGDLVSAFDTGMIHVNNNQVASSYVLKDCDYISHRTHRHENPVTAGPIEIIENNDDVLVINKPASIPCHPCGRYRFNSLVFIIGKEMGITNLRNIYRLDRLTSGVLILGKTAEMTRVLMDQVVKREVQKEYVCRVMGRFPDGTIKVDQPLQPLSNKLRLQVISPNGKASQTTFTRLSYNGRSSVVRCLPHTGRTHQIRVHLQFLGHPIINDVFYNCEAWGPNKGKNGVYEISFDEVCERIMQEHSVTLWDGGENPLYGERLRQMESKELKFPNTSRVPDCSHTHNIDETEEEPQRKLRKVEAEGATIHKAQVEMLTSAVSKSGSQEGVTPICDPVKPDQAESGSNSQSANITKHVGTHRDSEVNTGRPGFEMSKWSVDASCDLCKKKPIDPQEKNLVMFLHALKYKGPGWAYETRLPDWAKEDWNREDDYIIGTNSPLT